MLFTCHSCVFHISFNYEYVILCSTYITMLFICPLYIFHMIQFWWTWYVAQVVSSSLIFREDIDVGRVMLGDLHQKNKYVKLQVDEMVQGLKRLRSIQLNLMNYGLGLKDPTDNLTFDIASSTRALLGEAVAMVPDISAPNPMWGNET